MGIAASEVDLRGAAPLARESVVVGRAVALAHWVGTGRRPVTAGRVLRKADVPAAGAVLGVNVPPRLRTMADIPALHRPWCFAVATGLLEIGDGWVTGGPALGSWPTGDADLLAGWLAGLRAVCAAESYSQDEDSVRLVAIALLTVLGEDGTPRTGGLRMPVNATLLDLCKRYGKRHLEPLDVAVRYYDLPTETPFARLLALLAEFGAVTGEAARPTVSPLGRWAAGQLAAGLPGRADPGLSADEMIAEAARFSDEEQQDHVMRGWLAERQPAAAAREILTAAERMPPLQRGVAFRAAEGLGEYALPAWQDMAAAPWAGPYARAVLASWEQGPEPSDADWQWLAVEAAAVALDDKGPDEALNIVWESMPGADLEACLKAVRASCHPDATALARAVAEFAASGAPRSIDQVADLKVSLVGARPPIWRRVRLPVIASLADLHHVIQVLFGWDGDHLHVFQAGKKQYGDPFVGLDDTGDEDAVRLRDAVARGGGTIGYTYDLGAYWEHQITLERTGACDPGQDYPVCVAYKGDSPVEYWSDDDPAEPEPFDLAKVNRELAALGRAGSDVELQAIDHDDDEPSLAFLLKRSGELKRALVDFALSPRSERHLKKFMGEAANRDQALTEDQAIDVIDRFALQYRLPDGQTVLDRFVASRRDLTGDDRELLHGWHDLVEGVFEIRRKDGDSLVLLNLIDDLEYRVYSNMGPGAFRPLPPRGFLLARLVPIHPISDAWLVSGSISAYPESDAAQVAKVALDLATKLPALVYRNPERIEQGWKQMREDRASFVEFFGGDELVLPPAEAEERLNAYYRHRQEAALTRRPTQRRPRNLPGVDVPAFEFPPDLAAADTVGMIYDETDGLNFYIEYGMLRELFAEPTLSADKRYADVLREYLRAETIGPLPFRRLVAGHPDSADAVFRKVLRKPNFSWAEHGEALLRRRKPRHYDREPRPGFSVIGARLSELVGL